MILINHVSVLEQPTVLKSSSSSDSGASEDFKNFSDNNNDKNINPNRSNDGFSGNNFQFDLWRYAALFSF
jgi:hypothetical protein